MPPSPSSTPPPPPPARLKARTEFSITLDVPRPTTPGERYRFEYREAGSTTWDHAKTIDAPADATEIVLDDLNPTCTYEIRVYAVIGSADGPERVSRPSEVAAVDTEVPGCTPEPRCIIL